MKRSTLCGAMLLCSSALWAAKAPRWTTGADPAYPEAQYITGVGIGNDLEGARSNARAEISKVFQARVQQTATDKQTESSASVGKTRGPATGTQDSAMDTRVSTDSLLEGVVIAQTWQNAKTKKHFALAVLDKPKTRQALAFQITDKEETIGAQLAAAKSAAAPVEKARALNTALAAAKSRDDLQARRRVVDPAPIPDLNQGGSTAEIRRSLGEALDKIRFTVDADGGEGSSLKETVSGQITGMGFKVVDSAEGAAAETPVLKVKCRLKVENFDRGNPTWKYFRWLGTFELTDSAGKVLSTSAPSGTDGHIVEETARAKTRTSGEDGLAREAQLQISKYIFGE